MSSEQIQLQGAVRDLSAVEAKTRLSAAKVLFSAGLREYTGLRREALASDDAWDQLIKALGDTDAKVVENAAGALAQVIGRYRRDLSAFEPLRALLSHKNKQIRVYAARGIAYLDHPQRWAVLIPMLDDKTEPVKQAVVLAMVHAAVEMPAAERARARKMMEHFVAG